jgi:hypothetical protein
MYIQVAKCQEHRAGPYNPTSHCDEKRECFIMRYFFYITLQDTFIEDREGAEFKDLAEAHAEANQAARDLVAEELLKGNAIGPGCSLQIVDQYDTVLETIEFESAILSHWKAKPSWPPSPGLAPVDYFHRANRLFAETRDLASSVKSTCIEIRARLRAIS